MEGGLLALGGGSRPRNGLGGPRRVLVQLVVSKYAWREIILSVSVIPPLGRVSPSGRCGSRPWGAAITKGRGSPWPTCPPTFWQREERELSWVTHRCFKCQEGSQRVTGQRGAGRWRQPASEQTSAHSVPEEHSRPRLCEVKKSLECSKPRDRRWGEGVGARTKPDHAQPWETKAFIPSDREPLEVLSKAVT